MTCHIRISSLRNEELLSFIADLAAELEPALNALLVAADMTGSSARAAGETLALARSPPAYLQPLAQAGSSPYFRREWNGYRITENILFL